mmetsp:Transcript_17241/g.24904  ORF Transcript_17241/g.24904 Transcript_17241/m.24904 type:complete len:98 (-) Transcript_17241:543-836(-)
MFIYEKEYHPCLIRRRRNLILQQNSYLLGNHILAAKFDLTDDGKLKDFLGTRFTKNSDGSIILTQPKMVSCILDMVGLDNPTLTLQCTTLPPVTTTC